MLAATGLAIFIVPVLFVVITKLSYGDKKLQELQAGRIRNEEERKSTTIS
jgi:HAE1 family hydrophobic/amphiphilic exporter-1